MIGLQGKKKRNAKHLPLLLQASDTPAALAEPVTEGIMNQDFGEAQKEQLITILTDELKMLRSKIDASQQDIASRLGLSRQSYGAIESKAQKMTWSNFLALLLIFTSNEATAKIINWIEAYPPELKQYLSLTGASPKAVGKNAVKAKSDSIKPSNIQSIRRYVQAKSEKEGWV